VEQVRLVEPDLLARVRMCGCRLANLPRAQFVVALPFKLDPGAATVSLDLITIFSLKYVLP